MNRKAVLIDSRVGPHISDECGGDLIAFRKFLLSAPGGAWLESEVVTVRANTASQVEEAIRSVGSADFFQLVFVGRGSFGRRKRPWSEVEVSLPSGEMLEEQSMNPGTARCLMVFDCTNSYCVPSSRLENEGAHSAAENREEYSKLVLDAEAGLVRIFADPLPTVKQPGDSLLNRFLDIAYACPSSLSYEQAAHLAESENTPEDASLSVKYFGGRRMRHFPFKVTHQNTGHTTQAKNET